MLNSSIYKGTYYNQKSLVTRTVNMGLTCSKCVALVKGAWTWLTASMSALAVLAICSISKLYRSLLCFSLATSETANAIKHLIYKAFKNDILMFQHKIINTTNEY